MRASDDGKTATFEGAEILALFMRLEAEINNSQPWFAAMDQASRYRYLASALRKVTGARDCTILNILGASDDPDDGSRIVPAVRLVYDAMRKAA